ncbi:NAD(P)-dependent oxidoreductase [Flavilitoribacter nigricans]|uniref:Saccharopine dehydrogenase [NAD(+), L-lysine-forming] n=1 Tax=Flavilitoribacter nigricans (strain ATCC 23147 / DSM 23189 / NBRC 102662 / NCIMB 1420 / SS-2) TaxID=1122177 RepID=A0A2D0NC53_FLAN2|nr:NAD(P)-dependent oxidoreductase [Flavilitoribacter nigricans]PHN05956.1 alanine dehydrogenase [Flavilitoribacter nigricans DSM 23189 = NBRC 102662]
MKIGVIRERKNPPDQRVALTPEQCARVLSIPGVDIVVEPSPIRSFTDEEYADLGIPMQEDLSDCDVLMGVKEVPVDELIPGKTYFFFSHTIKKQAYNRKLLQAVLAKNIRLIDYEVITDEQGRRLIAFGRFAGMVGAHNGVMTYGLRTRSFHLPRMQDFMDYEHVRTYYRDVLILPPIRIVLTGSGRVGQGANQVLRDMGVREVSPDAFLEQHWSGPVFTHLTSGDYVRRKDGGAFNKKDFYANPDAYESNFARFARVANLFINGIYWNNRAPAFFTREEMSHPDFKIRVIADVTCDIAPVSSIPATLKASTIADPIFGYDPVQNKEVEPFQSGIIDMMTIDNLPSELPRDASQAFGEMFLMHVLPELLKPESKLIERATIAVDGDLGPHFEYLRDYVNEGTVG